MLEKMNMITMSFLPEFVYDHVHISSQTGTLLQG